MVGELLVVCGVAFTVVLRVVGGGIVVGLDCGGPHRCPYGTSCGAYSG